MDVPSPPDWVFPPPGGFTADTFLRMRGLPRRTELIDGSLVFASPRERWHSRVVNRLFYELAKQAPDGLDVEREMAVRLAKRQVPEPDVLVLRAEAFGEERPTTHYFPEDVVLAVEVVSPESEDRDRLTKPQRYAAGGIPHFWRVENVDGRTVVYVYELDPATRAYALTGIHHDRLKLTVPFDIDIDLTTAGHSRF